MMAQPVRCSRRLQSSLLRAVFEGCADAYAGAKSRGKTWMFDAIPTYRRLEVEARLQGLVPEPGFKVSLGETPSTHYTQIESDLIVITAVTRSQSVTWVPPYKYRETLATSGQLDWLSPVVPQVGAKLYALLIYGGRHHVKYPTLVQIVFPDPLGNFAPGTIDLRAEFPEIVKAYMPPETEAAEPEVALRSKRKKQDGTDGA